MQQNMEKYAIKYACTFFLIKEFKCNRDTNIKKMFRETGRHFRVCKNLLSN